MACPQKIQKGIDASCDSTVGGIKEILIANYDDFTTADLTDDGTEIEKVNLKTNTKWFRFRFRKSAASLTHTLTIDDATGNNFVQSDVAITFPKQETKKRVALSALATAPVVMLVKDVNGEAQFLGENEPVQATAGGGQTGQARTDANMYNVTLTNYSPTYPKFLAADAWPTDEEIAD